MLNKYKEWIVGGGVVAVVSVGAAVEIITPDPVPYTVVDWKTEDGEKPNTDKEWADSNKASGLAIRFDYQLEEMLQSHSDKLLRLKVNYDKATLYPDAVRWEVIESGVPEEEIEQQVAERLAQYKYDYEQMQQIVEQIAKEIDLRAQGKVDRKEDILLITPSTEEEKAALEELTKEK